MTKGTEPMPTKPIDAQFWTTPPATLTEALKVSEEPETLIRGLLVAAQQATIHVTHRDGLTVFEVTTTPSAPSLDSDPTLALTKDLELRGTFADKLELVYQIVRGIESEFSSTMLLPPELRRERVSGFCRRIGVSEDLFSAVLKNWTRPAPNTPQGPVESQVENP